MAGAARRPAPRLFFDSGVFLEALLVPWSASRALLILARQRVFRPVLAEDVRAEVDGNLTTLITVDPQTAERVIEAYARLLGALSVEPVAPTATADVLRHRHLIRHQADVPILVAALRARPDWVVTSNTRHFSAEVASRTGLRICTPKGFTAHLRL